LGFDKGFSGDTNHPRGLVEFSTKPDCEIDFYINEKLAHERGDFIQSESPYMVSLTKTFEVEFKENVLFSKYLSFKNFPYDRATIFLNGVKIGRYLKNSKEEFLQDEFYLINTFLKPVNTLEVVVWSKASDIKTLWDFKSELKYVIMLIGDREIHQLY